MNRSFRRILAASTASVVATAGLVAGALPASAASAPPVDLLRQLVVEPESNSPAYERDRFEHWVDANRDGCDTRREVLKQESAVPARQGSRSCSLTGQWVSYYDGATTANIADLEIDHAVALSEAWRSGARGWNDDQRRAFANDLDFAPTLVAVSSASNQAKSDKDFAEWRPPAGGAATCRFAVEQVQVKYRWNLSVDTAERDALAAFLPSCGSSPVEVPARAAVPAPGGSGGDQGGGGGRGGGASSNLGDRLSAGRSMSGGQWLMAPNGRYGLAFQADGNLVAYGPADRPLWHAGTHGNPGARFTLQQDGNAVITAADGRVLWHSHTWGSGGSVLRAQSDGNAVVYRADGAPAWYSGWDQGQRAGAGSRGVNLLGR
jgi:hypothetical protein